MEYLEIYMQRYISYRLTFQFYLSWLYTYRTKPNDYYNKIVLVQGSMLEK
jgi:hypothetical protein